MINVINLHEMSDKELWLKHPDHVYIGRERSWVQGSKWGNPYVICKELNREQAVQKYRLYLHKRAITESH